MEENTPITQPTLKEVKNQLESWRKNKINRREPIPKNLWEAAAELARKHSIATVSKTLHLSYADLKDRVYGISISEPVKEKTASFIELKCNNAPTAQETTLELYDLKRDLRLKISFKGSPCFDITSLIKSFCQ